MGTDRNADSNHRCHDRAAEQFGCEKARKQREIDQQDDRRAATLQDRRT
jgi:hypothetical protein